ncbi:hypothetical protein P7D22_09320 [Lichenihabitans sp. Uapishka_5]|uniref:hypothetical protein n=1 Tax=Lichenihabitans sp. Uapishka_5 TaxID=3037302 RepID=UPI0029E7D572|nr:hypothetical protein [Lichenihabitans sp. Uapishka_5]MDX7951370.1 hypothetical protein [Lichenihabitans sp. Uapishka_5]
MPLVPVAKGEVTLCLAVLQAGSLMRRVGGWISRFGADEVLAGSRVGRRYEAWARDKLASAIASNPFIPGWRCTALPLKPGDRKVGDVDLLFSLGELLVAGEVQATR